MNEPNWLDEPCSYAGYLFPPGDEIEDGSDFNEVAKLACQLLGIEQPKPGERIQWPEKKPDKEKSDG